MSASPCRGAEERQGKEALLRAALVVIADAGFCDGRVEDIATMAGVSKGAVYLQFPSKAALFQAAVRSAIAFHAMGRAEMKRELVRIMIRDGAHFPDLAECFYRELLAPRLAAVRAQASSAAGTAPEADPFMRFPQLALLPECFGLLWNALFGEIDPLDEEPFAACLQQLLAAALPLEPVAAHGVADDR